MGGRKRYTPEEKVKILREIIEDGKTVSAVAEGYGLHPNNIFNWRKQLFEGAPRIFEIKRQDVTAKAEGRKAAELEAKLRQKDEVIADIPSWYNTLATPIVTLLQKIDFRGKPVAVS